MTGRRCLGVGACPGRGSLRGRGYADSPRRGGGGRQAVQTTDNGEYIGVVVIRIGRAVVMIKVTVFTPTTPADHQPTPPTALLELTTWCTYRRRDRGLGGENRTLVGLEEPDSSTDPTRCGNP